LFAVQSTNLIFLVENVGSYAPFNLRQLSLLLFYTSIRMDAGGVVGADECKSDPSNHDASSIVVFFEEAARST